VTERFRPGSNKAHKNEIYITHCTMQHFSNILLFMSLS